ncbi:hypothetical protein K661_01693 [Piscirickettsia salmonis LF-89 = ATCC VR-1361]|nr:hypothetical protein K661_01693 [Piscirickettsia salmonis LF-89 = ATCC VR-1361]
MKFKLIYWLIYFSSAVRSKLNCCSLSNKLNHGYHLNITVIE